MRTTLRLLAAAAVTLVLLSTGAATPEAGASEPGLESQYVAGVNAVRADAGLPPLAVDGELTAVARAWADQMASENRIWHNPNLANQVTAPWLKVGENVGTGVEVGAVMDAFVNSPAHYRNIVDADFDFIGVGVSYGTDGRMYTAHVFMDLDGGAPAPTPPPAPEPEETTPAPTAAAQAPTPSVPDAAVEELAVPAPPAAPPAAASPERIATVLGIVEHLDGGVA
jgi:hypothetical protein